MGQISLEFYQKKKSRWPFSDECIPWEVWSIKVNVVNLANEQERQICREKVGEKLARKSSTSWRSLTVTSIFPRCPHSRRWTMCSIRVWKTFSRICTRSRTRSPMLWARQLALPWGGWSKTHWHCKGQPNSWSQMLLQCLWSSCKNRKSHYIVSEWIYTSPV